MKSKSLLLGCFTATGCEWMGGGLTHWIRNNILAGLKGVLSCVLLTSHRFKFVMKKRHVCHVTLLVTHYTICLPVDNGKVRIFSLRGR